MHWKQYANKQFKDSVIEWSSCETGLTRLRILHTRLARGLLMENTFPPYCEGCLVPLTVKHILTECPEYLKQISPCFGRDGVNEALGFGDILCDSLFNTDQVIEFVVVVGIVDHI